MPRVNVVKAARKDYPQAGIKKGDTYYWWKFRYGGKHMSLTRPRRSQLTQSDKLAQLYDIDDELQEIDRPSEFEDRESFEAWQSDAASTLNDLAERARTVGEEYEESRSNMEDSFPSGCPMMDELEEKVQQCEDFASSLEDAASTIEQAEWDDEAEADAQDDVTNAVSALDDPTCDLI